MAGANQSAVQKLRWRWQTWLSPSVSTVTPACWGTPAQRLGSEGSIAVLVVLLVTVAKYLVGDLRMEAVCLGLWQQGCEAAGHMTYSQGVERADCWGSAGSLHFVQSETTWNAAARG